MISRQAARKHGRDCHDHQPETRHAPAQKPEPAGAVGVSGGQLEIQARGAEEKPRPQQNSQAQQNRKK